MKSSTATLAACCFALLMLQGCASIVSGTSQLVSVDTPGCPAASCELTNEKGKWYINSTPGTTTVSRAYGPLAVSCKSKEVSGTGTFNSTTKGMAFGNILFGGVIGAGVDMSSGAAYDYPVALSVPMSCSTKPEQAGSAVVAVAASSKVRLGIRVENLTAAVAAAAGQSGTNGVIVTGVDEEGLGKSMGLKVGHILLEVNGRKIANYDTLASDVGTAADDGDLEFVVLDAGALKKFGRRKGVL